MAEDLDEINGEDAKHLWRVMAWSGEFARNAGLSSSESASLERAAVLQCRTKLSVDYEALTRLAAELGREVPGESDDETERDAEEILRALFGSRETSERARALAMMLEQCKDLNVACELEASVSSDPVVCGLDGIVSLVSAELKAVTDDEVTSAERRLPVFAGVAQEVLAMLASRHASLATLDSLISRDAALAVHLIKEANSAVYAAHRRVTTIAEALARIGVDRGRRVVGAAVMREMFRAPDSHGLWNHSLDVAQTALGLAKVAGVDGDAAFLAGLVHDIGKLVCLQLPGVAVGRYERLTRAGCPDVVVERVVFGNDHARIGGRLLRGWRFAEETSAAVASHHEPELSNSALSGVLYLAEIITGRDEGLESEWRKNRALGMAGLREEELVQNQGREEADSLRFVA